MRSYKNQFDSATVERIDSIVSVIESIQFPTGPSRYYGIDLILCLKSGALIGSLVLVSALMELFVRGLIVAYSNEAQSEYLRKVNIEKELESNRQIGFKGLLEYLVQCKLFDEKDSDRAVELYEKVRIPTHHGLPDRLVNSDFDTEFFSFEVVKNKSFVVSQRDFEEFVEEKSLPLIEEIIGIIKRNDKYNMPNKSN